MIIVSAVFVMKEVIMRNNLNANEASLKSYLEGLPQTTSLYYDTHVASYNPSSDETNDCSLELFTYGSIATSLREITRIGGGDIVCTMATDGQSWAVSALLIESSTNYCVSSNNKFTYVLPSKVAKGGGEEEAYCDN